MIKILPTILMILTFLTIMFIAISLFSSFERALESVVMGTIICGSMALGIYLLFKCVEWFLETLPRLIENAIERREK